VILLRACLAAVALAIAAPGSAHARPVVTQVDGIQVDWTRGLVIARAGAAADLRAPTAAVARVKAERVATERAVAAATRAAQALPRVGSLAAPAAAGLEGEAVVLDVTYASDGTAVVEVGLPIEAVRRSIAGSSKPVAKSAAGPTALVIDATALEIQPAVGYQVAAGSERYAGPVLWMSDRAALAADPRLGKRVRRIAATKIGGAGALELAPQAAPQVAGARSAGAVIVVLVSALDPPRP
jgi:hypothetical protein